MTDQKLRGEIDALWLDFYVGGITNPLTVIEQITYLMFCRLLDQAEAKKERRALKLKRPYRNHFDETLDKFKPEELKDRGLVRWSAFSKIEDADRMLRVV